MTIGTPQSLGTGSASSGTTCTVTTGANIVAGDLAVVAVFIAAGSAITVSSISDGTNSYTKAINETAASGDLNTELWYKNGAAAVSSGATITITISGSAAVVAIAAHVSGVLTASSLDQTAVTNAAGTSNTATTGVTTQTPEIVFGAAGSNTNNMYNGATDGASSYTNLGGKTLASTSFVALDYIIIASLTSVAYTPSWNASQTTCTVVATFKPAPAVFASFNMPMCGI